MDIHQLETKFFSESNVVCILSNMKERIPMVSLRMVTSGMIRAFELMLREEYIPTIRCINSSACFFTQCEHSRAIQFAPCC